mmetsp:Transcript_29396/g.44427  ORF Transcript_29396/g.44427 Transcript_29396/m.44427 type:complete len:97 (+) Transcript_29396:635-925(+)
MTLKSIIPFHPSHLRSMTSGSLKFLLELLSLEDHPSCLQDSHLSSPLCINNHQFNHLCINLLLSSSLQFTSHQSSNLQSTSLPSSSRLSRATPAAP